MTDLLGISQIVGGLVVAGAQVADPFLYTDQEKARDGLTAGQQAVQQQAIQATAAAAQAREETTQKMITFGLAGVLGVSGLYLASKLVSK